MRVAVGQCVVISIHALREEGDRLRVAVGQCVVISIHALREEGDDLQNQRKRAAKRFLSTPSARRATSIKWYNDNRGNISIHALREEGDAANTSPFIRKLVFLSTPSARRATVCANDGQLTTGISIHALREEGDGRGSCRCQRPRYFYPRPPRGGRPPPFMTQPPNGQFLSTPSARRATFSRSNSTPISWISIHALREEGDVPDHGSQTVFAISIHALREEGDVEALI